MLENLKRAKKKNIAVVGGPGRGQNVNSFKPNGCLPVRNTSRLKFLS
jgi:hypothetical protein